jgi:hypothetical protein
MPPDAPFSLNGRRDEFRRQPSFADEDGEELKKKRINSIGEPPPTPDQVRGRLSPEHALNWALPG